MEQKLNRFREILAVAVSRIDADYFQLPVADADAAYRERVYCYELYHQLRRIWRRFPFSLAGEIDKTGNPHFQDGPYARSKPDLVVHSAGDMAHNLAVVEVKASNARPRDMQNDMKKLTWFCHNAGYFRGIFLMYGEGGEDRLVEEANRAVVDADVDVTTLEFLYHRHVGGRLRRIQPDT